jgi:hypothetical protein
MIAKLMEEYLMANELKISLKKEKSQKRDYRADKVRKRCNGWERKRVDQGSQDAKVIRAEIERLSSFQLNPVGTRVETGYEEGLIPKSEHLDYEVLYNGVRIAEIDVTGSNYTFNGSKVMPVRYYKGLKDMALSLPTFAVYWMKLETGPIKDSCVWIRGADVVKCDTQTNYWGGKKQTNYITDKADWDRGLESLVEEFSKLAKIGKTAC